MSVQALTQLIQSTALRRGEFTLASGQTSHYLIDLKTVTMHPNGAVWIADAILQQTMGAGMPVDAFGGMAMGGVPIAAVVCARSILHRPVMGFFVRKADKRHGTGKSIEGCLRPGMRTILIEDVTTTGGSVLHAVQAVRAFGAYVSEVVTVVDRLEGAQENLAAHGITLIPLLTRYDILGDQA